MSLASASATLVGAALFSASLVSCTALLGDFTIGTATSALPDGATPLPESGTPLDGNAPVDSGFDGGDAGSAPDAPSVRDASQGDACPLGTNAGGGCAAMVPVAPATQADLASNDVSALTLPAGETLVNVDTGSVRQGATTIRAANGSVIAREVISGIAYQQRSGAAVFTFAKLTIPSGSKLKLVGTLPVVLVTVDSAQIDGEVVATPMDANGVECASGSKGAGGGTGGAGGTPPGINPAGKGAGGIGNGKGGGAGGASGTTVGGGGGGGHAALGGEGSTSGQGGGGGGASYAGPPAELSGGAGGGGGAAWSDTGSGGTGGAGGGALQLVAGVSVAIGNGQAGGGVNVGGCGGGPGVSQQPGGGGGAGGTIFIEAPTVQLGAKAVLAANGGGGGIDGKAGSNASFDDQPALGATTGPVPLGGNGGAGATVSGGPAMATSGSPAIGYGGGGAAGFIRVESAATGLTRSAAAIVSPSNAVFATITVK